MHPAIQLYQNGRIITLDSNQPVVNSVLVREGVIVEAGNDLSGSTAVQVVDLQGQVMVPGLVDTHVHLQGFGRFLEGLQLVDASSAEEIAMAVVERAAHLQDGEWIFGRGWDQSKWKGKTYPADEILNAAAPNHPVMLTRVDGHAVWVNRRARELAGFTSESALPAGGDVVNDCIFVDNAINIISDILPDDSDESIERQIRLGAKTFSERGLTGIHDVWQDRRIIRLIQKLIKKGEFPLRCNGMLAYNDDKLLNDFFTGGYLDTPMISIRAVKTFLDGALGSRGAALLEPYSDNPYNRGLMIMEDDEFEALAIRCRDAGFQLNTHAIGDRATRTVLDTYEKVLKGKRDHRWRIEHAQMVADADVPRFRQLGVVPSLQPSHCTSDMRWLADCIGEDRTRTISRFQSFIQEGVPLPGGSDCPIEVGDPLIEFHAVVTRQDAKGYPPGGWHAEQRVSPLDALRMFTTWAAYAGFSENRRGQIRAGYDADFTVVDQDITQMNDERILDTNILLTVVAGKAVYSQL